jgi:hypothetical protein
LDDVFLSLSGMDALANGALPALTTLRLRGNIRWSRGKDVSGIRLLATTRGLPRLTVLDLHQTTVGPEAARALAEGPLLARLRWLSLANRSSFGSAPIGTEAARELAQSPRAARLVHLDLSNNQLDDAAAQAIASSPHLGQLASLNLWHNRIGPSGALALASGSLPALTALDLRANPLPAPVQDRLRERFGTGVRYGPGRMLAEDRQARYPPEEDPPSPTEGTGEDIPF